jgi:hypothetical protein
MTVQASGGDWKIERRRDAVLKPRSHVIAAIDGVPINRHFKPIVVRVVEIGSAPITGANVILKETPAVEAANFKFPWAVKFKPHLSILHRNPILHRRRLMAKRRGGGEFESRSAGIGHDRIHITVVNGMMATGANRICVPSGSGRRWLLGCHAHNDGGEKENGN